MTNHPNRRAVATIISNDSDRKRISLYIRRLDADHLGRRYAIITTSGEDAGQYRFSDRKEALDEIGRMWGYPGSPWDLQYA